VIQDPFWENNTNQNGLGGVAEVAEHPPSKHKSPSSNPVLPPKRKKEKG
jgi:hypothetical protein